MNEASVSNKTNQNANNKTDSHILEQYEKIGNVVYKLDMYSGRLFSLSFIVIVLFLYSVFVFFYGKKPTESDEFYTSFLPILLAVVSILLLVLLGISVILQYSGRVYKRYKKYDIKLIVKLYFYELANNPEPKRKKEIIKHLTYNLHRVMYEGKGALPILTPYNWRIYFDILAHKRKFELNTYYRVISLLEDLSIYLEEFTKPQLLRAIGDCLQSENYRLIAKKLNENEDAFNEIKKLKIEKKLFASKIKKSFKGVESIANFVKSIVEIVFIILSVLVIYFSKFST